MADKTEQLTITFDGKEYTLDDFELGELEWLEEELGIFFADIGSDDQAQRVIQSMKAATRLVYIIKKREDPEFTLDEARKLKLSVFDAPQQNGNGKRPTRAAKAAGARGA